MNKSNITSWDDTSFSFSKSYIAVLVTIQILIIIAAIAGNLLVCLAICVDENLRKTAANYFIFSLAVSDILTASLSMPFDIDQILKDWRWDHGPLLCTLWTTVYLVTVPTSILSLLTISIDRYKAISDPLNKFRRTRFMTRKRAAIVVAGLWSYSIIFALIPKMGWSLLPGEDAHPDLCYFDITVEYSVLNSCMNFYLPLFIMCVIYFRIYKMANKMNLLLQEKTRSLRGPQSTQKLLSDKPTENHSQHTSDVCPIKTIKRQRKILKRSVKTAKSILVIVCAFFCCWIPYTTVSIVGLFCRRCFESVAVGAVYPFLLVLGYLNSALNPPLYSFHNPKFKETFRKILCLRQKPAQRGINFSQSPTSDTGSKLKNGSVFYSSRTNTGLRLKTEHERK